MSVNQDLRAAIYSDAELGEIVWCLQQGADANQPLHHGSSPLLEANTVEIAATLLEYGAHIDAKDDFGLGVLHTLAYSNEALALANFYQEHGANTEVRDVDGRTALLHCLACPQGAEDAALALLAIGANVRTVDTQGNNALHCWAEGRADAHTLQRLLDLGVDPGARNRLGQSVSELLSENPYGRVIGEQVLRSHIEWVELHRSPVEMSRHSLPRRI